jgi:hypothetical protein
VDAVRAGLKDGTIHIAPNGDVEVGPQGLPTEMRDLFVPPPVPSCPPPSTPGATPQASSLVTLAIVSPSAPVLQSSSYVQRTTLPASLLQRKGSVISYNLGTPRAR